MGLFSWDCEGCSHPLLMPDNTDYSVNCWMTNTVAVLKSGKIAKGFYDGYGRLAPTRADTRAVGGEGKTSINPATRDDSPTVYHRQCWELLGQPTDYAGASQSSDDQGHFFATGAHRHYPPHSIAAMEGMRPYPDTPPANAPTFEVRDWRDGHRNLSCEYCDGTGKDDGTCIHCDGTGLDPYGCEMCWESTHGPSVVCGDCGMSICEGHTPIPATWRSSAVWGEDDWKAAHVHECRGPRKETK